MLGKFDAQARTVTEQDEITGSSSKCCSVMLYLAQQCLRFGLVCTRDELFGNAHFNPTPNALPLLHSILS